MHIHAPQGQENESPAKVNVTSQPQSEGEFVPSFMDQRSDAVAQRKLQEVVDNSPKMQHLKAMQQMADGYLFKQSPTIQKKENSTGLPDNLKSGIESLSGMDISDVKVHYNSAKPAQLQAHAYAQGTDIHVAVGQEKHLAHEAWHVVQQKQGRVKPTMQLKGKININDDKGLEREADVMGAKALQLKSNPNHDSGTDAANNESQISHTAKPAGEMVQRIVDVGNERDPLVLWSNVRGLVEKVYRRRKTLFEWSADDAPLKEYKDYESLAIDLDKANQSKASAGRSRPGWAPGILKYFDKTWGGKRHRRHIIMSSLMRDAVYAVTDNIENDPDAVLAIYNEIVAAAGFGGYDTSNLAQAEAALVYVLHNNPANLILDSGPENSAIGGLAHNVDAYLKKDDKALALDFALFQSDPNGFLRSLAHGFEPAIQQQIIEIVSTFRRPENPEQFRAFLEMIYDNNALDIMTNVQMPAHTPAMLELHGRFVSTQSTGDLQQLYGVAMTYIFVGISFPDCLYKGIW